MEEEENTLRSGKPEKTDLICIAASLSVYVFNRFVLRVYLGGPVGYFCRCYLNDLMSEIFFLPVCDIIFNRAGIRLKSWLSMMAIGMAAGALWEFGAPFINAGAVCDPLDLLCYFAGINVYCLIAVRNRREKTIKK